MTSRKLKPTAGPWVATPNLVGGFLIHGQRGSNIGKVTWHNDQNADDAQLIAEAGTVFHECGLSPRELLERCSAMEAALNACKDALEWVVEQGGGPVCEHEGGVVCFCKENNAINAARAALAKHKEV